MCLQPGNATPLPARGAPGGVRHLCPCRRPSANLAPALAFCLRAIACGLDKLLEAGVRHFVFVDIKRVQEDTVLGDFVLEDGAISLRMAAQQTGDIVWSAPHDKLACRHQDHLSAVLTYDRRGKL